MAAKDVSTSMMVNHTAGPTVEKKMAFADTECAQALLDLAMSRAPVGIGQLASPSMKSPTKRMSRKKGTSPPKRQCFDNWGLTPPANYNPNSVLKLESNDSNELWKEIVQRVKLDHSYSLPGQLKEIADQRQDGKEGSLPTSSAKSSVSLLHNQNSLIHLLNAADSSRANQENNVNASNSKDVYQPNDTKYKNFNLLLKCLKNVDDGGVDVEAEKKYKSSTVHQMMALPEPSGNIYSEGKVERSEEQVKHDTNANDVSGSSEEGLQIDFGGNSELERGSSLFTCHQCMKSFSKRRYLIKHCQRMHPGNDTDKGSYVLMNCPNCSHSISKRNFKRHSTVCNAHMRKSKKQLEMDLANCQFCGIRMRRHILVKHLAQEHCVDNLRDVKEFPELAGEFSDTDSSTLSGSEHDDVPALGCAICGEEVHRIAMAQHILDNHMQHALPPSQRPTVTCQVCSIELPKRELCQHIADDHSVRLKKGKKSSPLKDRQTTEHVGSGLSGHLQRMGRCKHSMLQRFLSDSSGGAVEVEGGEQCQDCVGSLVTDEPGRPGSSRQQAAAVSATLTHSKATPRAQSLSARHDSKDYSKALPQLTALIK